MLYIVMIRYNINSVSIPFKSIFQKVYICIYVFIATIGNGYGYTITQREVAAIMLQKAADELYINMM